MLAKIQKWGNSLAVRIPKALADETGLHGDSMVEIRVENGQIYIIPLKEGYHLDDLLAQVTPENLHEAVETGDAQGNEAW